MHFEIDRETDQAILDDLASDVRRVLDDVRPAVADWEEMRARSIATVDDLATARLPVPDTDVAETQALLRWMADDHFTYLGYREYELTEEGGEDVLRAAPRLRTRDPAGHGRRTGIAELCEAACQRCAGERANP